MNHSSKINNSRQGRDPEATRAEILDAAEEEFAKYGLAGARTEAIAARTGVTKAMIYYYFKNKKALYEAVFQRIAKELKESMGKEDLKHLSAPKALENTIKTVIAFRASHPHRGMLWFHEAVQNQGKYGELSGWQESFLYLASILEQGVEEGSFRQLDPFLTAINIIGSCLFYIDARENLKSLRQDYQWLSPDRLAKHTQETINLILNGVLSI